MLCVCIWSFWRVRCKKMECDSIKHICQVSLIMILNIFYYCFHYFRIVFITVLVFGCLNHWHWKASIISHLSIILPTTPFDSLAGLLDSPYQITTLGDSYYEKFWLENEDEVIKNIADKKFEDKEASLKLTENEAVLQALSGPYALYLFHGVGVNLPEYMDCKLEDVALPITKLNLGFAFPKESPYRDIFNYGLQKMTESGDIDKIKKRHKQDNINCEGGGKGRKLGFKNTILVFIILGLGFLLSIICLVVENVIKLHNIKKFK